MSDYIKRDDALRGVELFQCGWAEIEAIQADYIGRLPAADVAEVVYCKECKHKVRTVADGIVLCSEKHGMIRPSENDFCGYGERAAAKTSGNGGLNVCKEGRV